MPVGFALLAAVALAADPVAVAGPRLAKGDDLVYRGTVSETADRGDGRVIKKWSLGVRVFVLDTSDDGTDCGVMTTLSPQSDDKITQAVKVVTGKEAAIPASTLVRLDLIRVDARGRVKHLRPAGPPPLTFDAKTPTLSPTLVPTDGPAAAEYGTFVPLPLTAVAVGDTWDTAEADRPPLVWSANASAVLNGRRVAEIVGVQQTEGFDTFTKVRHGWKRTETILAAPADGFASSVNRVVVRRDGKDEACRVETSYELQPSAPCEGVKYREARADLEAAWAFAAEAERLRGSRPKAGELDAGRAEVARYLEQRANTPTAFRVAVEAAGRRFESGTAPPVAPRVVIELAKPEPPAEGKPAPDFVASDVDKPTGRVRLSGVRGQPAVVAFFKPKSETSEEALTVCEATHRKYGTKATVIALAVGGDKIAASEQRAALKFGVPVYDGTDAAKAYAVDSYPRFYLIDGEGTVRWAFDAGVGPEVGTLLKKQLDAVLAEEKK